MRLPLPGRGSGDCIEVGKELRGLLEYYMRSEGVRDYSEALENLVELGYGKRLSRRRRGAEPRGPWLSVEWSAVRPQDTLTTGSGYAM